MKHWKFRLWSPLNIGGTIRLGNLRFTCRLWWFGFTEEMSQKVWKGIVNARAAKKMRNEELLHHLIQIFHKVDAVPLSGDDFILSEVENRLFPQYDGDNVTWENWGWKFKNGMELIYHPELKEPTP